MEKERPLFPAWIVGAASTAVPVALVSAWAGLDPLALPSAVLLVVLGALLLFGVLARGTPSPRACAWCAGAGFGLLAGVLLAQPTPTSWLMSDIAWHTAKVARVADGAWLEDPILRVRTIYPFTFHLVLAAPVALGVPLFAVLWCVSPLVLVLLGWSFFWLLRGFLAPRPAAWGVLALPFFFYAPGEGFAYLPNPFNASLIAVFLGLGALVRAKDGGPRSIALLGGFALGVAGLGWYGHLPWITLTVLGWALRARRSALLAMVGAAPAALVLLVHLTLLAAGGHEHGSAIVEPGAVEELSARALGSLRNLTTLSGSAELAQASWWLGPVLSVALLVAWARRRAEDARVPGLLLLAAAFVGLSLLGAGLAMTFWRPFSWRYGFLLYALLLAIAARARPFSVAGLSLPLHAACALSAPWTAGRGAFLCLARSRAYTELHAQGGRDVGAFLAAHTRSDEPVFASNDTWDRVIGASVPRPGLVARNGGIYNFAPADVVVPRWAAYQAVLSAVEPETILRELEPYRFRFAVVARDELDRQPGLGVIARSFELALETPRYVVVDLTRRRP